MAPAMGLPRAEAGDNDAPCADAGDNKETVWSLCSLTIGSLGAAEDTAEHAADATACGVGVMDLPTSPRGLGGFTNGRRKPAEVSRRGDAIRLGSCGGPYCGPLLCR